MDQVIKLYQRGTSIADICKQTGLRRYPVSKAIKDHQTSAPTESEFIEYENTGDSLKVDLLAKIEALQLTQDKLVKKVRKLKAIKKEPVVSEPVPNLQESIPELEPVQKQAEPVHIPEPSHNPPPQKKKTINLF
jgi:hypothetical protein